MSESQRPIAASARDDSRPLATALITTFNLARFLPEAIESALNQDLDGPLEVIVVDDGSTDDTPTVLASYGTRIRPIRQTNGGRNASINTGLCHARGHYIGILDADDVWPLDRLRRHVEFLDRHPEVGLVQSDMEIIDQAGRSMAPSFFASQNMSPPEGSVLGNLLAGNFVSGGASTFRSSLLPAMLPIDPASAYPDWWIAVCVAAVAELRLVPGISNYYRFHGGNNSLGRTDQMPIQRHELAWRRWMFTHLIDDPAISARQLYAAYASLRYGLGVAALDAPGGLESLGSRDTEAAAGIIAALPAPAAGAMRTRALMRAIGHDPQFASAHQLVLEALAAELRMQPVEAPPLLDMLATREHVCVASLPELLATPTLLQAFAADPASRTDTTLVIMAPAGSDPAPLVELFQSDPVLGDESINCVLIAEPVTPPARSLLAHRADTALTVDGIEAPFDALAAHRST